MSGLGCSTERRTHSGEMPEWVRKWVTKTKGKRKNWRQWPCCENEEGEEMRFSLIFQASYTMWIFIWTGRQGREVGFIWPLTDYPFVNISHHFPFSKPKGGMGIVTSTNTKHEDRSQIECRTSLPARCDTELWSTTGRPDPLPNGIKWLDHFCRTCREQATNSHQVLANVLTTLRQFKANTETSLILFQ